MDKLEKARKKYRPIEPRIIFVAEAPPENINRFFYYEKVTNGDALFVNIIRVLYPEYRNENGGNVKLIRSEKKQLLERLQADGYYLIDALPEPISLKMSSKERIKLITKRKAEIAKELRRLIGDKPFNPEAPEKGVVLLKSTVFEALEPYLLTDERIPVINQYINVPFPSHGHTAQFSDSLPEILAIYDKRFRKAIKFMSYSGDVTITKSTDL